MKTKQKLFDLSAALIFETIRVLIFFLFFSSSSWNSSFVRLLITILMYWIVDVVWLSQYSHTLSFSIKFYIWWLATKPIIILIVYYVCLKWKCLFERKMKKEVLCCQFLLFPLYCQLVSMFVFLFVCFESNPKCLKINWHIA